MSTLRRFGLRLLNAVRPTHGEPDLAREIDAHLTLLTDDFERRGLTPQDARLAARRALAGEQVKDRHRDARSFVWLDDVLWDVRYALRQFRRSPSFTAAAVGMLALGIGINAAVFTVVKAVLFEGFPLVPRNERLVYVTSTPLYYPDFEEWRSRARSFEGMALVWNIFRVLNHDGGVPETYFVTEATPDVFRVLGVEPFLGRSFLPSDGVPGAEPVVILRYELWERRFGSDRGILGRTVQINGTPTTVIGVMPRGFSFPADQEFWTPLVPTAAAQRRETSFGRYVVARLANGVTLEHARAEVATIERQITATFPGTTIRITPVVMTFREWFVGANASMIYKAMWVAAGLVLLMVCANVANLSIDRAVGRSREMSIRLALGAGRGRAVRQLLVESALLSVLGGLAGWWIARIGVQLYAAAAPSTSLGTPPVLAYSIDYRVLAYLCGISTGAALWVAWVTATHLTQTTVKDDSRGIAGGMKRRRVPAAFVGVQMVLAVVLLATTGVMIRSFINLSGADLGIDTGNVLSMDLSLYSHGDRYPTPEAQLAFYDRVETGLKRLPGVASVAFGSTAPTGNTWRLGYETADSTAPDTQSRPTVGTMVVSADYFTTLGARIVLGRSFEASDRSPNPPVTIVNQQFADRQWPGENPLGKRLRLFSTPWREETTPWHTVMGVVSNIVQDDRTGQVFEPLVYLPHARWPGWAPFTVVRTTVAPRSLAAAVNREIYAIDPGVAVPVLWTLDERFHRLFAFERTITVLFLVFASIALLVASIGLYAIVTQAVSRRVHEIGIRMAIGASNARIVRLVFAEGLVPVAIGLTVGLALSLALTSVLKAQLVGVSPADPLTLVLASAVLVVFAMLGCWIPARRAGRVDPIVALRSE